MKEETHNEMKIGLLIAYIGFACSIPILFLGAIAYGIYKFYNK